MASHYRDAAKCLKAVDGGRTTLKTAAYKTQNPPRTVALVSEVRRHRKALETAIAATGLREKAGGDAQLLLVAVYDAVAGRGAPKRCGGKLLRAIREVLCGARINQSSRRWRAGGGFKVARVSAVIRDARRRCPRSRAPSRPRARSRLQEPKTNRATCAATC